jgi:DNA ligase-1
VHHDEAVWYGDVVGAANAVAETAKRSEKVRLFAELLRRVSDEEIPVVVGMLVGEPRQGRIGVGWARLRDARVDPARDGRETGDAVTVAEVDAAIAALASTAGQGSQRERENVLARLLSRLTAAEQHHFVRMLTGEMRQGANDGVVSDAVAKAAGVPAADLRRATMLLGSLAGAAQLALTGASLDVGLTPLVAVHPMLAATSPSAADAVAATGPASVEWKLDGIRVQAHKSGERVRLFTRGLNDITAALPNVVTAVRALPVSSIVLDGESLGVDEEGRPRRFQDTMSGLDTTSAFFFDVLHVDGVSLIDEPLRTRKQTLTRLVPERLLLPSIETDDGVEADTFAIASTAAGHEGVMVKGLDSPYQAGRRGSAWRKVKPVHTVDLVVLAAEWGHGRRAGWLSNLHLGARGDDGFVMVGKTFKGMTDELLRWQTAELQKIAVGQGDTGDGAMAVYVRPELVVEIALDGVQASRRYPGGVALRFARVKRYRPDKRPAEADTIDRVRAFLL